MEILTCTDWLFLFAPFWYRLCHWCLFFWLLVLRNKLSIITASNYIFSAYDRFILYSKWRYGWFSINKFQLHRLSNMRFSRILACTFIYIYIGIDIWYMNECTRYKNKWNPLQCQGWKSGGAISTTPSSSSPSTSSPSSSWPTATPWWRSPSGGTKTLSMQRSAVTNKVEHRSQKIK